MSQNHIPVYRYPADYAEQHCELDLYRTSFKVNVACKEAIENAIGEYYSSRTPFCLETYKAVQKVVSEFGIERTIYVLANTIRQKEWDGRFSAVNKQWAKSIQVFPDPEGKHYRNCRFVVDKCNPGLVNLFVDEVRRTAALTPKNE